MAIIMLGKSKCPLCGKTLVDRSFVSFCAFESSDQEMQKLSDSGAHFECIRSHPRREALKAVFCNVFGEDGQHRNGRRVSTPTPSVRLAVNDRAVTVCHSPTFLILRMPLPAARDWIASSFWAELQDRDAAAFEDKGIEISVKSSGERAEIILRLCPWAHTPSTCQDAKLVQELRREVSKADVCAFARDLKAALTIAVGL
jgi:hypothetical protein